MELLNRNLLVPSTQENETILLGHLAGLKATNMERFTITMEAVKALCERVKIDLPESIAALEEKPEVEPLVEQAEEITEPEVEVKQEPKAKKTTKSSPSK